MLEGHYGILFMFILAALISALFIALTSVLGPKKPNPAKDMPFESGEVPFELPTGKHAVKFYLAGMLFVLFDVELIFLFPWAVLYRKLGLLGFVEMMIFFSIMILGFAYAWRKGALEWK